jgi:tRNA1(Val) A37 N6-methylase TrmN6
MSSINPYYTFSYVQPDDYRFSHDSVILARRVFEDLRGRADLGALEVLDLCAGCGVIGLDFMFHCRKELAVLPRRCDFIEIQEVYQPYFEKNAAVFPPENIRYLQQNYAALTADSPKYDLILCNPPYFHPRQGTQSPSEFKNRCRFFIDSDFPTLLRAIAHSLKPEGRAYVLLRDLRAHNLDLLEEEREAWAGRLIVQESGDIRGTRLMVFTRQPSDLPAH